jgi:hypothetical protein
MVKKRRRSMSSQNEAATIVVTATRARHGGSNSARLLNTANATRIKETLSSDYRSGQPVTSRSQSVAQTPRTDIEELAHRLRAAAHHFAKTGNNTKLAECVRALPRGRRQEALLKWCVASFQIRWRADKESFSGGFKGTADDLAAALAELPNALGSKRPLSATPPATLPKPRTPDAQPQRKERAIAFRDTSEYHVNEQIADQQKQASGTGVFPTSVLDPREVRASGNIKHYATPRIKR